ncbi:MAG: glycosyltransferase family 4 protein [Candidatus Poribacteria bacterium]
MDKRIHILIVGLDQVLDKASYQIMALKELGINVLIYTRDKSGLSSKCIERYNLDVIFVPKNPIAEILYYSYLLIRYKPLHIEMYLGNADPITQIFYVILATFLGIPIITFCRGGEVGKLIKLRRIRYISNKICFSFSKVVLLTELHLKNYIKQHKIFSFRKLFFYHNRINIKENFSPHRDQKNVLFINSFIKMRHPDLLIKSAPLVLRKFPDTKFILVGSTLGLPNYNPTSAEQEYNLRNLINELNLQNDVKIEQFTDNPWIYYENAAVFVLPADIVFCNFSLLEAMERGVPAIVADVEDSEKIITDGVDGFIVRQTPEDIADAIIRVLSDEKKRIEMAINAREKIIKNFNIKDGAEILVNLYKNRIWKGKIYA